MDNVFGNMSTEGYGTEEDRLGGGGTVETDFYIGKIKMAYVGKSKAEGSNSSAVVLEIDLPQGKGVFNYRESIYVTNRDGVNTYDDKNQAGVKHLLPGWQSIDALCMIVTGSDLKNQTMETKSVGIYDFESKKDVATEVPVLTDLIGQEIGLGILKILEDVQKKENGKYVNTGETREKNEIDKFFHPELLITLSEGLAGQETPTFQPAWLEKNKGKTKDKTDKKGGAKKGAPGKPDAGDKSAPGKAAGAALFGKK
jgi:hypothetical protein